MKKGIVIGLGTLFIVTIMISGCGKSDEKKVEAPSVKQKATTMKVDKGGSMTDPAVVDGKEPGQQSEYNASEELPEELQKELEAAMQSGAEFGSNRVERTVTETTPIDADSYSEKSFEEKAADKGMKPLSKQ